MGSSMVNDEQKPPLYGVRVSDEYKTVRTSDLPPQALGKGLVQDTSHMELVTYSTQEVGIQGTESFRNILPRSMTCRLCLLDIGVIVHVIYHRLLTEFLLIR